VNLSFVYGTKPKEPISLPVLPLSFILQILWREIDIERQLEPFLLIREVRGIDNRFKVKVTKVVRKVILNL